MKKLILVLCLLGGGAVLWWFNGGDGQGLSASSDLVEDVSKPAAAASAEIRLARPRTPRLGQVRTDPVTISPCNIVALEEQTISSQVDGILESVLVDLGQEVSVGEMLARVDNRQVRAQAELLKIRALSDSARRIAQTQQDDAESKVAYASKANGGGLTAVPELEIKGYLLQKERYAQEVKKALEDQDIARQELEKIAVLLSQHEIKSALRGEVVKVFKRPGEAVKQAEPLFRVVNSRRLRIEGLCKVQQADLLRVGMTAVLEPELRGEQLTELAGHTAPITSLAVSSTGHYLASASEDRTVIIWAWPQGQRCCLLPHPAEVGAVAFGPARGPLNEFSLVSGCGDGQARLWLLAGNETLRPPLLFSERHEGAIRAVAFSGDGKWCATGGEDKRIGIWDAATGKHLYWLATDTGAWSVHKGAVTSLSFTPQGELISAGRDNCFQVWQLTDQGGKWLDQVSGRTGEVSQFSISPSGKQVLFDHGEELRLLERESWDTLGAFRGQRQGRFTGMAHFSPSGRMILTAASNGRIQLWKTPPFEPGQQPLASSSYEIRYFSPPSAATVTCGTFAADEKVVFTGGVDQVIRVWPVPPRANWEEPLRAVITYLGSQVERGTDTVRLRAEMDNPLEPGRRLRPGTFATLRVDPLPNEQGP